MSCRDLLMDFMGDPYPPVIQTAFREGHLGLLSDAELQQELRFQPGMLPNALIQNGPTLTAAAWQSQVLPMLSLFDQAARTSPAHDPFKDVCNMGRPRAIPAEACAAAAWQYPCSAWPSFKHSVDIR